MFFFSLANFFGWWKIVEKSMLFSDNFQPKRQNLGTRNLVLHWVYLRAKLSTLILESS